jgi:hypothetical protein
MRHQARTWPLGEIVEIEWHDALTHGSWSTREDHCEQAHQAEQGLLKTVGYLVRETKHSITVAQSMSSVSQHISDSMTIPRGEVHRIRKISKVR